MRNALITLLGIPVFALTLIVQSSIVSRMPLLHGTADLVLLVLAAWSLQENVTTSWQWALIAGLLVSFVSGLPSFTPLIGYFVINTFARILRKQIWQTPILAMFATTVFGTLTMHVMTFAILQVTGVSLPVFQSLNLITLPSALLNLILAVPIYAAMKDFASWLYPVNIEI
ncbi:MAG TPA: hypothetical protein VHO48_04125 [Anaerolineaceae bacterium]|nr:hypothetical protein [Anaerolineaceae bacterium]